MNEISPETRLVNTSNVSQLVNPEQIEVLAEGDSTDFPPSPPPVNRKRSGGDTTPSSTQPAK